MHKPNITSLYHYQSIELYADSPTAFKERGVNICEGIYLDQYKLNPLIYRKAYYSSLSSYNDPFECDFIIDVSKNDALEFLGLIEHLKSVEQVTLPVGLSRESAQGFSKEQIIETFTNNSSAISNEIIRMLKNTIGFYCLTPTPDDMTMWAHYGDNHKGIVLEFERTSSSPCGTLSFEVDYFDSPPRVKIGELFSDAYKLQSNMTNQEKGKAIFESSLRKLMYSKTKVWEHENEWRTTNAVGISDMPGRLKSIIFGLKTKREIIDYFLGCNEFKDVEFKYTIKCNDTYKLKVVDRKEFQLNYWLSSIR